MYHIPNGHDVVKKVPCSGRQSKSSTEVNIAKLKKMVLNFLCFTNQLVPFKTICAKKTLGFYTTIKHLTRLLMWTNFWPKTQQTPSNEQPPYYPDMTPSDCLPKTTISSSRHPFYIVRRRNMRLKNVLMIRLFVGILEGAYFEIVNFDE